MAKQYKIHPAIGIARVGTSAETFIGPEIPGQLAPPEDGRYRDTTGELRRQAARYWVFEYDSDQPEAAPQPVAAAANGVARIEWTVHLANKKAFWFEFLGLQGEGTAGYPATHPLRNAGVINGAQRRNRLIIDPGPRTLTGANQSIDIVKGNSGGHPETWPGKQTDGKEIRALGSMSTDAQGRLLLAGGFGTSVKPGTTPDGGLHFANNDGWFDDVADGPVSARVVFDDGTMQPVEPAWVIVGPPDYAPPIENIVTMHDAIFDMAVRQLNAAPQLFDAATNQFKADYQPSFTREIYPILRRAAEYVWVIDEARGHHRWNYTALARKPFVPAAGVLPPTVIFARLRAPENWENSHLDGFMPKLRGDNGDGTALTLTRTQYHSLNQWKQGLFQDDWPGAPPPPDITISATRLDRAALENCTGGAFFPGIEAGWILRDPRIYQTPFCFRFKPALAFDQERDPNGLTPGSVTMRSALPWQADFYQCDDQWWPAQRPNQVRLNAAATSASGTDSQWDKGINDEVEMVQNWWRLGVVVPAANPASPAKFHQAERDLP